LKLNVCFYIQDELPALLISSSSIENQTREHNAPVITESVSTTRQSPLIDEPIVDTLDDVFLLPKPEPPPAAKPLNKARINEFATLLSSSVHLTTPTSSTSTTIVKKQVTPTLGSAPARPPLSPARSDEPSFSSIPSATSDRDERESFHTVQSNSSDNEQTKKQIDARYNEKLDDRGSIKFNTANIKALFEQKISDTHKALSQSSEHLLHLTETKQHKKIPVSFDSLKRNLPNNYQQPVHSFTHRRQSYQDSSVMNRYPDHLASVKDIVIEDKQVRRQQR
jgi:hypothetical protein